MRPTDFPAAVLSGRAGEAGGRSDQAEDSLLDLVGDVAAVLRDRLAALFDVRDGFLDLATALTQFTLDAHARFAHLALEAVARGRAAALEAAQLRLSLARRRVRRDRVVDAGDEFVAGRQRDADRDQHGALGVVAEDANRLAGRRLRLLRSGLGLVDRPRASGLCVRRLRLRGASARRFARRFTRFGRFRSCFGAFRGGGGSWHLWQFSSSSSLVRGGAGSGLAFDTPDWRDRTPVCNPRSEDCYNGILPRRKPPDVIGSSQVLACDRRNMRSAAVGRSLKPRRRVIELIRARQL